MRAGFVTLVLVFPLIVPRAEPERRSAERFLGAYYYPWYYKERWTREPVTHTPKLGWYSSDDRKVAAEHIRWARLLVTSYNEWHEEPSTEYGDMYLRLTRELAADLGKR